MKKILLLLLFTVWSFGGQVFYNYEKAVEEAKKQNKLLMVVMEQEHCPWCHRFKERTLKSAPVETAIEEHFILTYLDKNDENTPKFLAVPITPVTLMLDRKNNVIHETIGYVNKNQFMENINDVLKETGRD